LLNIFFIPIFLNGLITKFKLIPNNYFDINSDKNFTFYIQKDRSPNFIFENEKGNKVNTENLKICILGFDNFGNYYKPNNELIITNGYEISIKKMKFKQFKMNFNLTNNSTKINYVIQIILENKIYESEKFLCLSRKSNSKKRKLDSSIESVIIE